jgi:hypothetical protein
VAAGTAAGARVVAVLTAAARRELPADCWVRDLTEVVPDPPARGRTASDGLVLTIGASARA